MKNLSKTISVAFVVVIIFTAGYLLFGRQKQQPAYNFIIAGRGDVVQKVSVTGRVKPAEKVDLAFEKSGKVSKVNVKIGDKVTNGQILAGLSNADIEAQLLQAEAGVESAKSSLAQYQAALLSQQAKLEELKRGTRPEELQIAETNVANTQKSLSDTQTNLENVKNKASSDLTNLYGKIKDILNDAYVKADDAVNKQTDEMFLNENSNNPQLSFTTTDSQVKTDIEQRRIAAGTAVKDIKANLDNLSAATADLDDSLVKTKEQLIIIRDFLTRLNDALDSATNISMATTSAYKGYVNTGRTNINTATTNITNHQQAIESQKILNQNNISTAQTGVNSAQSALASARDELALKKAGAAPEQIASQEAQVKQAEANLSAQAAQVKSSEANVKNIQAQLAKTIIFSPINGIVTSQDAKVGEIISANSPLVSLISEAKFQIEANVPEADIAKVKIGDTAEVTIDAYGRDVVFEAKVIFIDPAEIMIEGVATYKTTLEFTKEDDHIRPGMTANIDILTAKRQNVIFVPSRAVITKDGQKFVLVDVGNSKQEERKIETGLRGPDGNIEIISGLKAGEKVIISVTQ